MPQYVPLNGLRAAVKPFVRPLNTPLPRAAALMTPSPHQFYLTLKPNEIPPNVRIQGYIEKRGMVPGLSEVDREGGRKTKDFGLGEKSWRNGAGREARKRGGLKWALRER